MKPNNAMNQLKLNDAQYKYTGVTRKNLRIFFVCGKCRKFVYYYNRFSNTQTKKNIERRQSYMCTKYVEFTLFYTKNMMNERDFLQFQDVIKFLQYQNINEFPICKECAEVVCQKLQEKCNFYKKYIDCLKNVLDNPPDNILKQQLDTLKIQKESLNDSIINAQYCNNLLRSKSMCSRSSFYDYQTNSTEFNNTTNSQRRLKFSNPNFKSLTLHSAFHISFSGHYGCINDCRLGIQEPYVIDTIEFDSGLFYLVQLIKNIGHLIDIELNEIQAVNHVFFLDNPQKQLYVPLSSESICGKNYIKGIRHFRKGIETIFTVCERMFSSISEKTNDFMPPNIINLKEHKIFVASYIFEKDRPYEFTYAMKLLLFDLKCIQRFLFEAAIRNIE